MCIGVEVVFVYCMGVVGIEKNVVFELVDGGCVVVEEVLVVIGCILCIYDFGLEIFGLIFGYWFIVDDMMFVKGFDWFYVVGDVNYCVLFIY